MVNAVIKGISIELGREFGNNYKVHTESIEQGLKEPCFFITCVNPAQRHMYGFGHVKRYSKEMQFCIQYFPSNKKALNDECNDVTERLFQCLEYITPYKADMPVHGTNMRAEVVDDVLNFFVNYDFYTYHITEAEETMGSMSRINRVRR